MRKLVVRLVLAVAMVLPAAVVNVAPASAAYEWIQSWCRPDVWWYDNPPYSVQYWKDGTNWPGDVWDVNTNWPSSRPPSVLQVYGRNGYECGRFGVPVGGMAYYGGDYWLQPFEGGSLMYRSLTKTWWGCWNDPDPYCYAV